MPPDPLSSTDGAGRYFENARAYADGYAAGVAEGRERTRVLEEALIAQRLAAAITAGTFADDRAEMLDWAVEASHTMMDAPEDVREAVRQLVADIRRYDEGTAGTLETEIRASLAAVAVEDGGNGEGYEARQARPVPAGEGADVQANAEAVVAGALGGRWDDAIAVVRELADTGLLRPDEGRGR